jgi:hypothetical protein
MEKCLVIGRSPFRWIPIIAILGLLAASTAHAQDDRRPWDLSLRVFTEYNDNVPLAGDAGGFGADENSFGAGFSAAGVYRFVQRAPWEFGVGGAFVQTGYLEEDVNDFNYTSVAPNVYGSYKFMMGAMPSRFDLSLNTRFDWLGGDYFQTSITPQASLMFIPMPRLAVTVYTGVSFDDFDDDTDNPDVLSRDAVQYRIGVSTRYVFPSGQQSIGGLAEYSHNDADGDDYVFDSWRVSANFKTRIFGPVSGEVQVGYTNEDYTEFTTDPQREQDNFFATVALYVALSEQLTLDAYYTFTHMEGSTDEFTLDRSLAGIGLTYRF